jgi:hypothetical protein
MSGSSVDRGAMDGQERQLAREWVREVSVSGSPDLSSSCGSVWATLEHAEAFEASVVAL